MAEPFKSDLLVLYVSEKDGFGAIVETMDPDGSLMLHFHQICIFLITMLLGTHWT